MTGLFQFLECAALRAVAVLLVMLVGAWPDGARAADGETILIGAGKVSGVYFPVAGAICQAANAARSGGDPICVVVPGENSKASLEALRGRRLDFAIVQSDWQFWARTGADFFSDPTPFTDLNSVFALHSEPLAIAVRRDDGIASLADLKGKRVAVGGPGTASRGMIEDLLRVSGLSMADFTETPELALGQQTAALCGNRIDAAAFAVGSPSATLAGLTGQCAVSFVALSGAPVEQLLREKPFYRPAAVPAGVYAGTDAAVATFGVGATLVTRADLPNKVVRHVVAAVFDDLAGFRALHPALTWLDSDRMARDGLAAPLHPAAARYQADREGS